MRYSSEHKEQTRRKILAAAAAQFRAEGYDGLGVDGLAKAAGVTNGAFYGHFASKADAYREVVEMGLDDLRAGIERFRAEHGADWVTPFARFYFGRAKIEVTDDLCALPGFGAEMARAPESTRSVFGAQLAAVHDALAEGLAGDHADERAWQMLSIMLGGVTLARAVPDTVQSQRIADIFEALLIATAQPQR